jgi:glyoxylase-like metal-dependent hydrolase (beta-lactamase superfamily II)
MPPARFGVLLALALSGPTIASQPAPPADPLVKEHATVAVSAHVYVIPDGNVPLVPNVGIIVGSGGTLVVDTGLGPRNGEAVLREVGKVSRSARLYLVSTHFHPEHALGEQAFPPTATLIRYRNQQKDIDEFGLSLADTFSKRSAVTRDLLADARFRRADVLFDREKDLDLGGVRVRILGRGPTHTRGDTLVFVEGERVLFAGDVVMNRTFLAFASPYSSVDAWLASLDEAARLQPSRIVPSHGDMGDATLIGQQREYLSAVRTRARELKRQGKSADETAQIVSAEIRAKLPDWSAPARVADAVKSAYAEARAARGGKPREQQAPPR